MSEREIADMDDWERQYHMSLREASEHDAPTGPTWDDNRKLLRTYGGWRG